MKSTKKNYIEFKIMKKYIVLSITALALLGGIGTYYVWCSYHPVIDIKIVQGGKGDDIKIETPSVVISNRVEKNAASVELDILNFWIQYDHMNEYVIHNYKKADIKLAIEETSSQTILKYTGTVVTLDDKTENFNREIYCDFVLNANIQ